MAQLQGGLSTAGRYDTTSAGSIDYRSVTLGNGLGIGHTSRNQRLRYNAAVSFSPNGGSNLGAVAGTTFTFGD